MVGCPATVARNTGIRRCCAHLLSHTSSTDRRDPYRRIKRRLWPGLAGIATFQNTGIDQHLLRRNRQFDLIEVIRTHPDLLVIGIDEDTAIVVRGDSFEVIGQTGCDRPRPCFSL